MPLIVGLYNKGFRNRISVPMLDIFLIEISIMYHSAQIPNAFVGLRPI